MRSPKQPDFLWRSLPLLLLPWSALAKDDAFHAAPQPEPALADLPKTEQLGMGMMADRPNAVISGLHCHSPAANAGLMGGCEIIEADGRKIGSVEDFRRALYRAKNKPSIDIVYRMPGFQQELTRKLILPAGWWRTPRPEK